MLSFYEIDRENRISPLGIKSSVFFSLPKEYQKILLECEKKMIIANGKKKSNLMTSNFMKTKGLSLLKKNK